MHSKVKGNIGEAAVAKLLMQQGYAVFTELGDLSKTDLIALKDTSCIKIQVKYITAVNNVVSIKGGKSGPNYRFNYRKGDCDVFALYCPDVDDVAFISANKLVGGKTISLRLQQTANNQSNGIHWFKNYKSIEEALRDYTHTTETDNAVGNEIVQTYNLPRKKAKVRTQASKARPTKINWPSDQELLNLVNSNPMTKVGKILGVTDNAVRKHLKVRNLVTGSGLGN